jgi:hypothetical protein
MNRMLKYPKSVACSGSATQLIIKGQGVFLFEQNDITKSCIFTIASADRKTSLKVVFTKSAVVVKNMQTNEPYIDTENTKGLSALSGAYYWFSLDAQNQQLYAGVGEARLDTVIYSYSFKQLKGNKLSLETLSTIDIPQESVSLNALRILRDPITLSVPMRIKHTNELTMMDIAKGSYLPTANLSTMGQKLYNCIAGPKFVLDDADFPDFSKAIEYSIATPGLWCNTKLQQKANEFSKDKPNPNETYLRITLGQNNGESPGVPYVMEIWPIGHFSPVHNHGASNAVIKVLHGSIHVKLFPFLCDSSGSVPEFRTAEFRKGDITWITENLNQVHQLENLKSNTETCITIQCYMYDENNVAHYDYFDYLDGDGKIQQYEPDSDMDFVAFKNQMKEEWANKPKNWWCF